MQAIFLALRHCGFSIFFILLQMKDKYQRAYLGKHRKRNFCNNGDPVWLSFVSEMAEKSWKPSEQSKFIQELRGKKMNTRVFFHLICRDFGDCRLKFGAIWWEISRLRSCCSDRWGWNWLWIYFWCDVRLLRRGFQCAAAHSWRMRSKIPAPFCPAASS